MRNAPSNSSGGGGGGGGKSGKPSDLELFPGFKPAIEGCTLSWDDYPIQGVTYGHNSHYLSPFAVFKLESPELGNTVTAGVNSSQVSSKIIIIRMSICCARLASGDLKFGARQYGLPWQIKASFLIA